MKSKFIIFLLYPLLFLTFFSGVIRHDVKENLYLNLGREPQFDCVGQVFKNTELIASCVLIDSQFVLCAAHVFIEYDYRWDMVKAGKNTVLRHIAYHGHAGDVSTYSFVFNGFSSPGSLLKLFPAFLDSGATLNICDIALIKLKEPVRNTKPVRLNFSFDELHANVVGVGYGASGIANKPKSVKHKNKKIAGENVIDSLTGYFVNGRRTVLTCDFDAATIKGCNKMGDSIPRPLEYMCSGGDSGGGLFRQINNSWELIGICSQTDFDLEQQKRTGYYGATMGWTRVSVFTDWIKQEKK